MSETYEIGGAKFTVDDSFRRKVSETYPKLIPVDVDLYIDECIRRDVHPLSRLIVPRPNFGQNKQTQKWERKGPPAWIVTIDLMRARADQTGDYAPGRATEYEWSDTSPYPVSATAYVKKYVRGEWIEFSETAYWQEFYPGEGLDGTMWRKIPTVMLAKVAEARALRRGWPAQLQGFYESSEFGAAPPDDDSPAPAAAGTKPASPIHTPAPTVVYTAAAAKPETTVTAKVDPAAPAPPLGRRAAVPDQSVPDLGDWPVFIEVMANTADARGFERGQTLRWFDAQCAANNRTKDNLPLESRRAVIGMIESGKWDADIRGFAGPAADEPPAPTSGSPAAAAGPREPITWQDCRDVFLALAASREKFGTVEMPGLTPALAETALTKWISRQGMTKTPHLIPRDKWLGLLDAVRTDNFAWSVGKVGGL